MFAPTLRLDLFSYLIKTSSKLGYLARLLHKHLYSDPAKREKMII